VSVELASDFVLALAVTAPVFVTLELGLRTLYVTHDSRPSLASLIRVRAVCLTVAVCVSFLAAAIFAPGISLIVLSVVVAWKAIDSVTDLLTARAQAAGRIGLMSAVTATNGVSTLVFVGVATLVWGTAAAVLAGALAGSLLALFIAITIVAGAREGAKELPGSGIGDVVVSGLWLGGATGLSSITTSIPTVLLGRFGTAAEVVSMGLFQYVVFALEMLLNAVYQAQLPRFVAMRARYGDGPVRKSALLSALRIALVAGLGLPFVLVLVSTLFDVALLSPTVSGGLLLSGMELVVIVAPLSFVAGMVLSTQNRYRAQFLVGWAGILFSLAVGLLLVPLVGLLGAIAAYASGFAARFISAFVLSMRCDRGAGRQQSGQKLDS
jgi:O-antigen/teichoic acid export membrane protein